MPPALRGRCAAYAPSVTVLNVFSLLGSAGDTGAQCGGSGLAINTLAPFDNRPANGHDTLGLLQCYGGKTLLFDSPTVLWESHCIC